MFPIRDNVPSRRAPLVTLGLIAVNTLVFVAQVRLGDGPLRRVMLLYGVVPLRFTNPEWAAEHGFPGTLGLPFLTYMFLHGGLFHLVVNMWTLWIFGDNVEDRMGRLRFLVFYVLSGAGAALVHLATNAASPMPTVGASGAIAGVLGAYMLMFPTARVLVVVPIVFYPLVFAVPAVVYLVIWFLSQFFSGTAALLDARAAGNVAWWAHIGGFVLGMLLSRFFAPRDGGGGGGSRGQPGDRVRYRVAGRAADGTYILEPVRERE